MRYISLTFLFCFGFVLSVSAQNQQQRNHIQSQNLTENNQELYREVNKLQRSKRKEAIKFALKNDLPISRTDENGEIIYLSEILDDGTPLYIGLYNSGSAQTSRTDALYEGGDLGLNLSGTNLTAGVWDGGLVLLAHQAFGGRAEQLDNASSVSDHATHVTGTIIASGEFNANARGMAFNANASTFSFANDLAQMTQQANSGMLLSNHSYGLNPDNLPTWIFGAYTQNSRTVDIIHNNNPYYLAVFAAGNSRNNNPPVNSSKNGFDLLTDKNLAKNAIAVANVLQVSDYTGPSSVQLNQSSSWGPTDDGRVKPDISTKGTNVVSTTGSGTSAYASQSGTSMAAPGVTGTLLLIQELYSNLTGDFLKSHSLKALLLGTARPAGFGPGPDYQYGFGLMDAKSMASVILGNGFDSLLEETILNDGDTHTYEVSANTEGNPIEVTIAWNDPAGFVQSNGAVDDPTPRLINDLDVRLIDESGDATLPFRLNPNIPNLPAQRGDNNVDNVEKISLENPEGDYTIEVNHKGVLNNGSQEYTIVVTGISDGLFNVVPSVTNQTVCSDETEAVEYQFTYQSVDNFDGPVDLSVSGLPDSVEVEFTPDTLTEDGEVTLSITNFNEAVGLNNFQVVLEGGGETEELDLSLEVLESEEFSDLLLWYPADGVENVTLVPDANWSSVNTAQTYEVEISLDSDFETVLINVIVEDRFFDFPQLEPETQYFWRVRPINECLEGEFTEGSFTTESLDCKEFESSNDTPLNIPDEGSVESIITIPVDYVDRISDINVMVDIEHPSISDLVITLTNPSGVEVTLLSTACEGGEDMDVIFDDAGVALSCNPSTPALSGILIPFQSLAAFVGDEDIDGDWVLTVSDIIEGEEGIINSFAIQLCDGTALSTNEFEQVNFAMYPNPTSHQVTIDFDEPNADSAVNIFDINGRLIKQVKASSFDTNIQVNVSDFSSGIYMVEITSGGKKSTQKLIVK